MWSFYKALIKNPRAIGAIIPSSSHLAQAIANLVPADDKKMIVDLGAGTGVITQGLLDHGIPPQRIIAVETSQDLINKLKNRFPKVNVLHGDAAHLVNLLKKQNQPIGTVICGLPMLILPHEKIETILQQIDQVLSPGGLYIKYTYGSKDIWINILNNYKKVTTKRVWLNIPPARVVVYQSPVLQ